MNLQEKDIDKSCGLIQINKHHGNCQSNNELININHNPVQGPKKVSHKITLEFESSSSLISTNTLSKTFHMLKKFTHMGIGTSREASLQNRITKNMKNHGFNAASENGHHLIPSNKSLTSPK